MRSRASWSTGARAEPTPELGDAVAPAPKRGRLGLASDGLGLALFGVLWALVAYALAGSATPLEGVVFVCVALPLGHLLADLFSGLLHWFADEFFEEDTPVVGPLLIHGFRDHHRNPRDILEHRWVAVSGYNALATVPILAALWAWPAESAALRAVHAVLLATTFSIAATNQLHRWAHADCVPGLVAWLQRRRLILSPEGHALHHARGNRAYCVTAGWLNPPLDALGWLPAFGRGVHQLSRQLRLARRR